VNSNKTKKIILYSFKEDRLTFFPPPAAFSMYYQPPYLQRGRGIGNILKNAYKTIMPALKTFSTSPIGRSIQAAALHGVTNVARDLIRGGNMGKSVKINLKTARQSVAKALEERQNSLPDDREKRVMKRKKMNQGDRKPRKIVKRSTPNHGKRFHMSTGRSLFGNQSDDEEGDENH
jgi:hypothetical protein